MKPLSKLLEEFAARKPIRTGSLIITVFGDAVSPHGSAIWLGSLIKILEPFGLNQRQIRTAVYRLVQEDWLAATQVGRRSYYSFTETGQQHYEKAARRIYAAVRQPWEGKWTLVLPTLCKPEEKELLRRELSWLGYGTLTPGLLAYPAGDRQALDETLLELGLTGKALVFTAGTDEPAARRLLRQLSRDCWNLDALGQRYHHFIERFHPLNRALTRTRKATQAQCFQARTLLVHEYRRIHLQDSDLPAELLPPNWSGVSAYNLAKNIYRAVRDDSVAYLMANMETVEGSPKQPGREFHARFAEVDV
ncbi:MAG: phenylacetic acid degradation operon negative regulatory protein PaaX [Gammaproteobacteria bacterium]|nr:phenylacetic acid degradation operon negative regulatory protein PaaX [Gammaproteobacteria bacterium]